MTLPPKATTEARAATAATLREIEERLAALSAEQETLWAASRAAKAEAAEMAAVDALHALPSEIVTALALETPPDTMYARLRPRGLADSSYYGRSRRWTEKARTFRRLLGVMS